MNTQSLFKSETSKGATALFGAALIYSSFGVWIRLMAGSFGDVTQVLLRFALAAIILAVIMWWQGKRVTLHAKHIGLSWLLGACFGGMVILFTMAVNQIKIADAVFLLYGAGMLVSVVGGRICYEETLTRRKIVALLLAFAGVVLYVAHGVSFSLSVSFGTILGLAAGVGDGAANLIRKSLAGIDKRSVMLHQFLASSIVAGALVFTLHETPVTHVTLVAVAALIVFALLQIKLNDLLLYGFQRFDVNVGSVILATEILFAAMLGFVFFGETLVTCEILGGLLIFAAAITVAQSE